MRNLLLVGFILTSVSISNVSAQSGSARSHLKGSLFFYWGWNRSVYTTSDISFKGNTFNFQINNVKASDKPYPFNAGFYLNPGTMTIPQYNFRLGYFLNDHYSISFGADHMKYVMQNNQTVKITGSIHDTETKYNGVYSNQDIVLTEDFLLFEHTDGLNYENVELRRLDALYERKNFSINVEEGVGIGFMYPRTNSTLLHNARNDEFHLSGYGFNAVVAMNLTFWRHFFIQSELKGGYINMPDIRITNDASEKGAQHFLFTQYNIVFGARMALKK